MIIAVVKITMLSCFLNPMDLKLAALTSVRIQIKSVFGATNFALLTANVEKLQPLGQHALPRVVSVMDHLLWDVFVLIHLPRVLLCALHLYQQIVHHQKDIVEMERVRVHGLARNSVDCDRCSNGIDHFKQLLVCYYQIAKYVECIVEKYLL